MQHSRRAYAALDRGSRRAYTAPFDGRRGISLLEMLVVMAALQVFLALMVGLLWAMVRIERSAGADFHRTLEQGALADQFRADVAGASNVLKKWWDVAAGPECLILRTRDGKTIVYRWHDEHLERSEISDGKTALRRLPLGVEEASVKFARTEGGRLISLWVLELHGQGSLRRERAVEFKAALGSELR
jgi:hypothetical protein